MPGVAGVNPDTELQRLESLARDGIEPRIVGLQMKAVSVTGDGIVFVIRVPKNWNPPHRGKRTEDQPDLRPKLNGGL